MLQDPRFVLDQLLAGLETGIELVRGQSAADVRRQRLGAGRRHQIVAQQPVELLDEGRSVIRRSGRDRRIAGPDRPGDPPGSPASSVVSDVLLAPDVRLVLEDEAGDVAVILDDGAVDDQLPALAGSVSFRGMRIT